MKIFNMFRQPYLDEDDGAHLGGSMEEDTKEKGLDEGETPTPEDKPEEQEEFDEITYNKETIKIPKSERQTYLQKGYNYDKVHGKVTEYEKEIQRRDAFAKRLGYDSFGELEQAQAQRELEEQADRLVSQNPGMDTETAMRLIQLEQWKEDQQTQMKQKEVQSIRQTQREALKNEPFFEEVDKLVEATLQQPGMENTPYDVVYSYVCGTSEFRSRIINENSKRVAEASKLAEQRTIANIHERKLRGIPESSDGEPDTEVELTAEGRSMAAAFGNDPKEIAKYVKKQIKK